MTSHPGYPDFDRPNISADNVRFRMDHQRGNHGQTTNNPAPAVAPITPHSTQDPVEQTFQEAEDASIHSEVNMDVDPIPNVVNVQNNSTSNLVDNSPFSYLPTRSGHNYSQNRSRTGYSQGTPPNVSPEAVNPFTIPAIPQSYPQIVDWLMTHFGDQLDCEKEELEFVLKELLKVSTRSDFVSYCTLDAEAFFMYLGGISYDSNRFLLYELSMISIYCKGMELESPDPHYWSFEKYLHARDAMKAELPKFPISTQILHHRY